MARLLLLAASVPLFLIGAAYPAAKTGEKPDAMPEGGRYYLQEASPVTYPPCRPGPGDDHCIQLYERGVRSAYADWRRRQQGATDQGAEVAMGGPMERAAHQPRARHRGDHAERCLEDGSDGEARGM